MKVEVSSEMHSVCPVFVGACITANIKNTEYSAELWREIDALSEEYRATLTTESLKQMESIHDQCLHTVHPLVLCRESTCFR